MGVLENRRWRGAALAAVLLVLLGCTSAAERLRRWEGRPLAELVAERGPASRIVAYPYGGRLYIWEEVVSTTTAGDTMGKRPSVGQQRSTRVYREVVLVGDDGVIIRTSVESGSRSAGSSRYSP